MTVSTAPSSNWNLRQQTTLDNVELYHNKFKLKRIRLSLHALHIEMYDGAADDDGGGGGGGVCSCIPSFVAIFPQFRWAARCNFCVCDAITEFTVMRMLKMPISFGGLFSCFTKLFSHPLQHLYFLFSSCLIKFGVRIFRVFILQTYPFLRALSFALSISCRNFLISKSVLFCVCKLVATQFFFALPSQNANHVFFRRCCWLHRMWM